MRKALIPTFLLLLGSVVLGATVFRNDIAQATGLAQAVTIDNTSANPVPVQEQRLDGNNIRIHEEGTARVQAADQTQQILDKTFTHEDPDATIDVSQYREIRVTVLGCQISGNDDQLEFVIDSFKVTCTPKQSKAYDVPGTSLQFHWFPTATSDFVHIVVHGRSN
jgi:hypothetical protein